MPNVQLTIATKDGPRAVEAWAPSKGASLALHKEADEGSRLYTLTHIATGCNLNQLMRGAIIERTDVAEMRKVLRLALDIGAPLWAALDKLEHGTRRAPKDVIAEHRDTCAAVKEAIHAYGRHRLRL